MPSWLFSVLKCLDQAFAPSLIRWYAVDWKFRAFSQALDAQCRQWNHRCLEVKNEDEMELWRRLGYQWLTSWYGSHGDHAGNLLQGCATSGLWYFSIEQLGFQHVFSLVSKLHLFESAAWMLEALNRDILPCLALTYNLGAVWLSHTFYAALRGSCNDADDERKFESYLLLILE